MHELILLAMTLPVIAGCLSLFTMNSGMLKTINLVGSAATTLMILGIIAKTIEVGVFTSGYFHVDHLTAVMLFVVGLLTFTATLFSLSYMEREVRDGHVSPKMLPRYYALLNLFSLSMISVLVVGNLGMMWVAVEGTTLASALLVAFYFNQAALEAAWKYVMICTVGICLALLGTILLYSAQVSAGGAEHALDWATLKALAPSLDPRTVKMAFIFILIGYGTKAGLAPMHTWLPDAHSQAPSPVSGLLSGALLSCALYALIRNLVIVEGAIGPEFPQTVLLCVGVLSILIAIPFVLTQHDLKRLLAYSSVEHMGLVTLGLGIGTPLAVYAAILHIVNHAAAKSALFYIAGSISQDYRTKDIKGIHGVATVAPLLATLFVLGVMVITGLPPFNIFLSKFMIINALFDGRHWLLGSLILLLLTGVFAGMMRYGLRMSFGAKPDDTVHRRALSTSTKLAIGLSLVLVFTGGLYLPEVANTVLRRAAEIIMGV
ncbi:MAG: hydrogenase 4 subunit F [Solidesulfovibrio sp.]